MTSLYIAASETIIRDPKHRYTHPTTGEVYGGTDYDDPTKCEEIGAIPLVMVDPQPGKVADGWEIIVEDGTAYRRPSLEIDPPLPPELTSEEKLERSDRELIDMIQARLYEDMIQHIIDAGEYVKQEVKDKITERVDLRSQINA